MMTEILIKFIGIESKLVLVSILCTLMEIGIEQFHPVNKMNIINLPIECNCKMHKNDSIRLNKQPVA